MLRGCLVLILFSFYNLARGELSCGDLFAVTETQKTTPRSSYRPSPESFVPSVMRQPIDPSEVRRFKGPEGSLNLFNKYPQKNETMAHATLADEILFLTLGLSFNNVAGVKGAINFFRNHDKRILAKSLRGDWGATQDIYRLLSMISRWINESNPSAPAVDLTSKTDLLRYLSGIEGHTLSAKWTSLAKQYYKFMGRPSDPDSGMQKSVQSEEDRLIVDARALYERREYNFLISPEGIGTYLVKKSTPEILGMLSQWIKYLNIPDDVVQGYVDALSFIAKNPTVANSHNRHDDKLILHTTLLRYFNVHLLQKRFPDQFSLKEIMTGSYVDFARIQIFLRQFDAFYKRKEILLEEALKGIEALNEQIDVVEQRLRMAREEASVDQGASWAERFEKAIGKISELRSQNLSEEEWIQHKQTFEHEYFAVEKMLQEWARQKQKSEIESFDQLSYQWDLLLPQRKYKIQGYDYDHVVFTEDVVEFFEKNPERGSYFLAALSKGYVGHQNASGLRKIHAVHPEFRDIKLLKHGGKARIVGRIINRTIHFFYIYESDRAYDDGEMYRLIRNYKPL